MAVLENFDIGAFGGSLLKTLCDLNGTVVRTVMADESADETDQNVGRGRLGSTYNPTSGCSECGSCSTEQEYHTECAEYSKASHTDS